MPVVCVQIEQLLVHTSLMRQQLMHIRAFYPSSGPLTEELLGEALAKAGGSVARTLVPVSTLGSSATSSGQPLVTLQLTVIDLEKIRTEAWVHAIPRPQL